MGTKEQFNRLLKPDTCQVFLFACPASLPISFAPHPWFVVNRRGALSRWEIFWHPVVSWPQRWGHLHKDFYKPSEGIAITSLMHVRRKWRGVRMLGVVEGALAERMANVIESSPETYPYTRTYKLSGPNSNTYVQWVLDQFPECGMPLPWNAFGKNFIAQRLQ